MATTHPLSSRLISLQHGTSRALLYPERGFQLWSYQAEVAGRQVETIYVPPPGREPADRRYGNPVLFPAVGVSNASRPDGWDHQGNWLPMPPHGWARNVYWQIEQQDAASLTAVVVPHPGFRLGFPFDFEMQMTYRLEPSALVLETVIKNLGNEPFPYALGFHPYLRAPLGAAAGARARCLVRAPAGVRLQSSDGWRTIDPQPGERADHRRHRRRASRLRWSWPTPGRPRSRWRTTLPGSRPGCRWRGANRAIRSGSSGAPPRTPPTSASSPGPTPPTPSTDRAPAGWPRASRTSTDWSSLSGRWASRACPRLA